MTGIQVEILDHEDCRLGSLTVAQLPHRSDLLDTEALKTPRVVLAEGGTYRFQIDLDGDADAVLVEPGDELFSFDDGSRLHGRLLPRQHVGRIRVCVTDASSGRPGWVELDVRPVKLSAEVEYRQMLEDITDVATEALLQGFAPASLALTIDPAARPDLLYQQFAFLHARISGAELRGALARVIHNPHVTWASRVELQAPGRPIPGSSKLARALARPGPRASTHGRLAADSVPRKLERTRTDPSHDSVPNQFVKYALRRWRTVAQQLSDVLGANEPAVGPVRRGRDAVTETLQRLDSYLAQPLFRDVGDLTVFPASNQVLHKQHGYREIFRTFVLGELGGRLSFDWDVDDVYSASQRNVATLYEYWCFLQLADALGSACGQSRTVEALTAATDGLSLSFKQGRASAVTWRAEAAGRGLDVQLFFNRTFLASAAAGTETSWSRGMRPDVSVRVRPLSQVPDLSDEADLDLWLHFDAKYRLEASHQQFTVDREGDAEAAGVAEDTERLSSTKREDLLKMHAYRDAIRRSAGAYVLYPGHDKSPPFRQFNELLPGLGAFVLRPEAGGRAQGLEELRRFLGAVLEHAAERASQHERERYWRGWIYATPPGRSSTPSRLPDLTAPPEDTAVLCGYVRSEAHAAWIRRAGLYNVRAGDRRGALGPDAAELQAEWLLLYSEGGAPTLWTRVGPWFVQTREQLLETGYPGPRGAVYLCAAITECADTPAWLDRLRSSNVAPPNDRPRGAPFARTWADLLGHK